MIKLIAMFTMLVDHIGAVFFPNALWLRVIGRIAFPLFAWGIATGYRYTRNWKLYAARCVIRAKVNLGDRSLTVFGSHFGLANSEQRNAVKTVVSLIDASEKPYVLMGDFNMVPEDEKLIPIYERMTDTAIYFNEPKLSFPSDKPDYKIDYIFVSKDLKVTHADIPDIVASDHRLHICDIEF